MINKHQIKTATDALAYITDCNLATVCSMAGKKSRSKSELERQINIAQLGVDALRSEASAELLSGTRIEDVLVAGSVQAWAITFTQK